MKLALLFLLFYDFSHAEGIDIDSLNSHIYQKIIFSADLENYPLKTESSLKKKYLSFDNITYNIRYLNNKPIDGNDMINLEHMRNPDNISEINLFGWTLRKTHMKMYPTEYSFTYNKNDSIDRNQYSSVDTSEPVVILHISEDGKWGYCQTYFTRGWILLRDLQIVSHDNFRQFIKIDKIVVLKDNFLLGEFKYNFGARIPFVKKGKDFFEVILPDNSIEKLNISAENYMEMTKEFDKDIISRFLESQLGKTYDWGGKNGGRDCSALIMDAFRPFGLNLPRNSKDQAVIGIKTYDDFDSIDDFTNILRNSESFCTFVYFPGHIMVYGGMYDKDFIFYHSVKNINGLDVESVVKHYLFRDNLRIMEKRPKIITLCGN